MRSTCRSTVWRPARGMVGRQLLLDDLGPSGDDAQGGPDLVSDFACEPPKRGEFLRLLQLPLRIQPAFGLRAGPLPGRLDLRRHAVERGRKLTIHLGVGA